MKSSQIPISTHTHIYLYIIYFRPENFPSKSHPIPHRPDFQDLHFEEIPSSLQPGRRDDIAKWPVAVRLQNKKGNNRIADVEINLSSLISIQIHTYIYISTCIGMWRRSMRYTNIVILGCDDVANAFQDFRVKKLSFLKLLCLQKWGICHQKDLNTRKISEYSSIALYIVFNSLVIVLRLFLDHINQKKLC